MDHSVRYRTKCLSVVLEIIETKQVVLKSFLELHRTGLASCGIKLIAASVVIFIEIYELLENNEIVLCWISSHIGIPGNEKVAIQAKASLALDNTHFNIPFF